MDVYEATRVVLARIQSLDAENAAKIMGFILIQEHGDKEMIRLAFGPESLLHSVVLKARRELGLAAAVPSPSSSPPAAARPPFGPLARQNPPSFRFFPLSVPSSTSFAPPPVFSRSALSGSPDELHDSDELVSPVPSPFFNGGAARGEQLVEEFHIQDRVSFLDDLAYPEAGCPSPGGSGDGLLFPQSVGWGINGAHHRQSWSAGDLPLPSDAATGGFGWKPCLYFARGYCKDGHACRFLHCGLPEEAAAGARMDAAEELLFRSKSQRISGGGASELMASAFPYSPLGSLSSSPSSTTNKWFDFLLQQQQNDSQRAALIRARMERSDLAGMVNPGSRQIYLTFPADSTFTEEDVSNYFSIYGPVQDVRIPYQQKRMFGFVTFVYPETVKLILAKGNPHFVCDARVLVKPYKEKGRAPDKCRKLQQQTERLDFPGSTTPTGLESRDPYDLQQLGARMLYKNSSSQELLLRRKLEEQQQALELQQAIELQARRLMNLQLLDLKNRSLSAPACINSPTITAPPAITIPTVDTSSNGSSSSSSSSSSQEHSPTGEANPKVNSSNVSLNQKAVNSADKKESGDEAKPDEDSDFHERCSNRPYLPESPFASPTKSAINSSSSNNTSSNSNHLMPPTPSPALDMAAYKSCFLQLPRFSSHGAIEM